MSKITNEQVKHVAHLARLEITEEEATKFSAQLEAILNFADQLEEVDTEGVEPTFHVLDLQNVLREDVAEQSLTQEEILKNAAHTEDGQFKVPSILGGGE
ncbi:Asp-tRNA(Asn)/Glu-tRNA(Gln) amidotransferase subunit GatC [Macrococcus armenti]|uniref:Aspartyl/glutamyl-tRNA(Asn/Gln) amidotransferase subunit C n=1 Tax=Macrococcus armenti TaxID=2875764 RepID=A0ABY3ZTM9_9STAP|nr:Asp-tRNA(Asn)/Glu-tRNA(Gln) amidotransferase subunit GatC [Macrococcus armenti]UBH08234.1 Asp-tRNA(Asn)/Glu-tRNA(Gln) amidotransferase subunit GatC [Macrococcus armenti]UBH10465.1 Asp-tRNA(Asn)/Glu-tRNA(Gln) amidotransferase subunit GatC [Macrococcus armenti]UBH12761.1 Asp-tRNA(Asn)/Glu-tRNA(Gln) amidotransferase subunit GatC [Macrococcus armenti]UBH14997.1 Asp-tRNA(Asn)/Glu-tRNA(Gln) amidotransferase subunit GatC [Macrococcus armenti]UBH17356.1 Asp-tRNA(Asn)/Glu-tRNA(Gln) amidotransferase 